MTAQRFLLARWNNDAAEERARSLLERQLVDGMRTAAAGKTWCLLIGSKTSIHQRGDDIVIGKVTDERGDDGGRRGEPSEERARLLIAEAWGAYCAVFIDRDRLAIMADPSGGLPVWLVDQAGLTIVSHKMTPGLFRSIGTPAIDLQAVTASLVEPASATHLSFVRGITSLIPGELLDLDTREIVPVWRPDKWTNSHPPEAAERLRAAVDTCAAASCEPTSMLQLSGGLDSSILAASLGARGYRPLAINFATADTAGDERRFAAAVADRAGLELASTVLDRLPDYRRIAAAPQGAAPFVFGLDDAVESAVDAIGAQRSASSVLTGQGGDAVFFQHATPLTSVDCARALGVGRAFWQNLPDAARRTRTSVWRHLIAVGADIMGRTELPTMLLGASLLTDQARALLPMIDRGHPWTRNIEHLPPGKRVQIVMLANSQIFQSERPTGEIPLVHPLLTQPVMEAALSIATFELACGRNDRGLARRIFADRLPPEILIRTGKGEATNHYSRAALANLPFLREFLLDGQLCAMGVTDRGALDVLLTREALFFSLDYQALTMQVSCEAWLRAWMA